MSQSKRTSESKSQQEQVEALESGNIYFCYRPKVEDPDEQGSVDSLQDVQRFYMVLRPQGKKVYRMLAVGRKHLPDLDQHGQQTWGFVESVSDDPRQIEQGLREQQYDTKTRGKREQPAARPVGEGVYEILKHGNHTHLIYALELPEKLGEAQKELEIESEGSYVLQIKNPKKSSPKQAGLQGKQKADFPKGLQERFRDRRFASAEPPDFLDYEGAELLLIAASDDVSKELGVELESEHETEKTAEILTDLRMRKSRHPIEPLFSGEWR